MKLNAAPWCPDCYNQQAGGGGDKRHLGLKKNPLCTTPTSSEPLRPPSKEGGRTKQKPYYVSEEKP